MTEPDAFDKSLLDIWELRDGKSVKSTEFTMLPTLSTQYFPLTVTEEDGEGFVTGVGESESVDMNPIEWTNKIIDANKEEINTFNYSVDDSETNAHQYYKLLTPSGKNIINSAKREEISEEIEFVNYFNPRTFSRSRSDFFLFKHPEKRQFCFAKANYTIFSEIETNEGQTLLGYYTFNDRTKAKNNTMLLKPSEKYCDIYSYENSSPKSPYSRPKPMKNSYIDAKRNMDSAVQNPPPIKIIPDELKLDQTKYSLTSSGWPSPFEYSERQTKTVLGLSGGFLLLGIAISSPTLVLTGIASLMVSTILYRITAFSNEELEIPFELTPTKNIPNYISDENKYTQNELVTIENEKGTWTINLTDQTDQINIFDYFLESGFEKTGKTGFVGHVVLSDKYEFDSCDAILSDCGNWYLLPETKLSEAHPEDIEVVRNEIDAPSLNFSIEDNESELLLDEN